MQSYFMEVRGYHRFPENKIKINQVLQRQVELIALAKKAGLPILLVEYKQCGPTCERIIKEIGDYSNARTFAKTTRDLFDGISGVAQAIKKFLIESKVSGLIVCGANGGSCVRFGIESIIVNGYKVWTDEFGIVDFNYGDFIYPYRYARGSLVLDMEQAKELNQLSNVQNLDDIIRAVSEAGNRIKGGEGPGEDHGFLFRESKKCLSKLGDPVLPRH